MCGRYAAFRSPEEIRQIFGTVNPPPEFAPSWNVAPTRLAPVVRLHPQSGARHLDLLRWGLVPNWVRDPKATRQPINARSETAATTPMFRDAFVRRRCLVPIDAFYEWQAAGRAKIPHAVAREDGQPMALAGLWEGWRGQDGEVLRTFTVLTTAANETLRPLHERMPVVLEPPDWPVWLGEQAGDHAALLRPSEAAFRVWPVATLVNNVRNDGPHLLDPAPSLV
ncbi:Abasic site processing protein [Rhodovastum atsumiense]|uniref:Abasic site processing protein n=1 Tax=Rhodovastum atsumiense TaxID=504468 RepID=A0A5M6IP82_9PROT|nr:SOS response-associated peptidase [Rhodovastum atsumiense]KAA5610084.1 SOS response-associated peptidase [Rhodovastum atsumiense]CAH2601446.1 Abasic site processing protein [Rhodovastum atsumiense]